jgi:HAD superfamily hydrolase (TIGR01509 family)
MAIKAVLFDMDGVVVDTEPVHEESRRLTYFKYGISYNKVRDIPVIGRNTDAIFADVHARYPFPVELKTAIKMKRDIFVDLLGNSVEPLPGVAKLIKWAKKKHNIALVTASAKQNVEAVLKGTGLTGMFDALVVAEDVRKWKPDPEGYLLAAFRLNVNPENCAVLEDSPVGVASAKAAGMKVIGVMTGQGGTAPKEADLLVDNLEVGADSVHRFIEEG